MHAKSELNRTLSDLENQLGLGRRSHSRELFRSAVEAWCDLLEWPAEVSKHGLGVEWEHIAHLGRMAFAFDRGVKDHRGHGSPTERSGHALLSMAKKIPVVGPGLQVSAKDYINAHDSAMMKMEPKDYLLIALAVAAAGYVIFIGLTRRPKGSPSTRSRPQPERWTLVLVVNAGRAAILDTVKGRGTGGPDGDQLYQAAQALWFGRTCDFDVSDLANWFDESKKVEEQSEYDVHLIRIDLNEDDQGLHRNANQMDRLDAFRRFQVKGYKATVSSRLPSDAYGTTDVYSR